MKIKKFENSSYEINGSDLFHWNSSIKDNIKLEIINWYKNLSDKDKYYVDVLCNEARDQGYENGANDPDL